MKTLICFVTLLLALLMGNALFAQEMSAEEHQVLRKLKFVTQTRLKVTIDFKTHVLSDSAPGIDLEPVVSDLCHGALSSLERSRLFELLDSYSNGYSEQIYNAAKYETDRSTISAPDSFGRGGGGSYTNSTYYFPEERNEPYEFQQGLNTEVFFLRGSLLDLARGYKANLPTYTENKRTFFRVLQTRSDFMGQIKSARKQLAQAFDTVQHIYSLDQVITASIHGQYGMRVYTANEVAAIKEERSTFPAAPLSIVYTAFSQVQQQLSFALTESVDKLKSLGALENLRLFLETFQINNPETTTDSHATTFAPTSKNLRNAHLAKLVEANQVPHASINLSSYNVEVQGCSTILMMPK